MVFSAYDGIKLSAVSCAVSPEIIDIRKMANDPNAGANNIEEFMKKTGIIRKHVAGANQTASDLAYAAAKILEENGRYDPDEIGVLVYVTQTPDYKTPATAYLMHTRLGLSQDCIVFDVNSGCTGFVYAISIGAGMLATSQARKALVLIGDTPARGRKGRGKVLKNTELLFGDAGAAILLEKEEGKSIRSAIMSDGSGYKAIGRPYGAWRHPIGPENILSDDIEVFSFAIKEAPMLIKAFMEKVGTMPENYDSLMLHQANLMIMKTVTKRSGFPADKCPISLDRFGNTTCTSVAVTIVDKYGDCDEHRDINLLASGFGIGLSWGVIDFTINTDDIYPMIESDVTYDDGFPVYTED